MHLKSTAQSYSTFTKILHWTIALLVVTSWMLGVLTGCLQQISRRSVALFAHLTVGLTLLDVLVLRALWWPCLHRPRPSARYLEYGPEWVG